MKRYQSIRIHADRRDHAKAKKLAERREWSIAAVYRVALRELLERMEVKR